MPDNGLGSILDEALSPTQQQRQPSRPVKTLTPEQQSRVLGKVNGGAQPKPGARRGIADRLRDFGHSAQEATGEFFDNMGASIADEWTATPQTMEFKHIRRPGRRPPTADEIAQQKLDYESQPLQVDRFGETRKGNYRTPSLIETEAAKKGTRSIHEAKASGETIESLRAIASDPNRAPADQKFAADAAHNLATKLQKTAGQGSVWQKAIRRATDLPGIGALINNSGHLYQDIQSAGETEDIVTEEDLTALGAKTKSGELMRTEETFGENAKSEMLPAMMGDAATMMVAGPSRALGRAAARAEASGAKGVAEMIRFSLQNEAPVAEGWRARASLRAGRGAVQGTAIGAVHDFDEVRGQGGSLQEAASVAATGALLGAPMGAGLEVAGGALWDFIGPTTKRWMSAVVRNIPPSQNHLDDIAAQILRENDARAATATVNAERARTGGAPVDDKNPEAHLRDIANALEQILAQKGEARAAYPDEVGAALDSPDRPDVYNPAGPEWWRDNTDLPDATTAGVARANEPREGELPPQQGPSRLADQADMSRNLERIKAEEEAAAQQARLEQAAASSSKNKQGPLTLAQTLRNPDARAAVVAAAGGQFDENDDDDVSLAFLAGVTSPAVRKAIIDEADKAIKAGARAPSLRALAAKHGISSETVRTILKVAGIGGNAPERVNLGALKEAGERNRAGESLASLAPEYGYSSDASMKAVMKRHGIETRDRATAAGDRRGPYSEPESSRNILGGSKATEEQRVLARARAIFARHGVEVSPEAWARAEAAVKKNGPAAGMAILATQTDDDDTKTALMGAAALSTGVVTVDETANYFSRMRKHVETMPDKTMPAADWIGKLGGGNVPFKKAEFDFTLKKALEEAKANKQKLSRADVLKLIDDNGMKIKRHRYARSDEMAREGNGYRSSGPGKLVVKGEDPTATFGGTPDDANIPPQRWSPNTRDEDTEVGRLERERERMQEEIDEHESDASSYSDNVSYILNHVGQDTQQGRRRLEEMIEDADDGSGDGELRRGHLLESIRERWLDEPDMPDSPTDLNEMGDWEIEQGDDGLFHIRKEKGHYYDPATGGYHYKGDPGAPPADSPLWYETAGEGEEFHSKYQAMGYIQRTRDEPGEYGTWGNLDDLTRGLKVVKDPDTDEFVLYKSQWDGNRGEYREQPVASYRGEYRGDDADELVTKYVDDNFEPYQPDPEEPDHSDLESMIDDLNTSRMASTRAERAREGLENEDWDERKVQAEEEDRQHKLDYYTYHAKLKNHDPEYYLLDHDEQQFMDKGRELGAVGYTQVATDLDNGPEDLDLFEQQGMQAAGAQQIAYQYVNEAGEPQGIGNAASRETWLANGVPESRIRRSFTGGRWEPKQYVFDESLPHHPLLRAGEPEGTRHWTDPDQHTFADDDSFNPIKYIALDVEKENAHTMQRIPGGKRYREIIVEFQNWPDGGLGHVGHWHLYQANAAAHTRMDVYNWQPGAVDELHPEFVEAKRLYEEAGAKWNDVTGKIDAIRAEVPDDYLSSVNGIHALMNEQQEAIRALTDADGEYLRAFKNAFVADGDTTPLEVLAGFEVQTDPTQVASGKGDIPGERKGWKRPLDNPKKQLSPDAYHLYIANQLKKSSEASLQPLDEASYRARGEMREVQYDPDRAAELPAAQEKYQQAEAKRVEQARKIDALREDVQDLVSSLQGNSGGDIWGLRDRLGRQKVELYNAKHPMYGQVDDGLIANLQQGVDETISRLRGTAEAKSAVEGIENPDGVPHTPFDSAESGVHLGVGALILEAAYSDSPMLAISTALNRFQQSATHLPLAAGKITYDINAVKAVENIAKALGFKLEKQIININGFSFHAWKLPPEFKAAVKKYGVPMMSLLAMTQVANQKAQRDGSGDTAADGVLDAPLLMAGSLLVTKGKIKTGAKGAAKEAFEYFEHNVGRRAIAAIKAANVTRHVAAEALKQGKTYLRVPAKALYNMALDPDGIVSKIVRSGGHASWGDVESAVQAAGYAGVKPEGGAPRLVGMKGGNDAPLPTKITAAQQRAKDAGGFKLYSNPIGPAFTELKRKTTPATLAILGYAASQEQDHRNISRMAPPLFALAALNAIGTRRLGKAFDKTGSAVLGALVRSDKGKKFVQFMNPEALLSPDIKAAVKVYEQTVAKGKALAAEFGGSARRLGPVKDRQISDVIEHEDWEGLGQANSLDVIVTAQAIKNEFDILARRKMAAGVIEPHMVIDNYLPRRYAHWDALDVYANEQGRGKGGGGGSKTRISEQKRRTLDIPVRDAESALRDAHLTGDPAKVKAAEDALDEAYYNQLDQRLKLGEIRESSYRTAHGLTKGYSDVAAAELFKTLAVQPDAIHPEFKQHLNDFLAARKAHQQAGSPAARAAAEAAMDAAQVDMAEVTRRFTVKGGDWVSMPDSKGLGVFRGMVVARNVAHTINGIPEQRALDKLVQFWKVSKTVFNPGTHIANVLSNTTVAHMAGLNMIEQAWYLPRAFKDIKAYGDATRHLTEQGTLGINTVNASSEGVIPTGYKSDRGLRELAQTTRPETRAVLAEASQGATEKQYSKLGKAARRFGDTARAVYNREDDIFRVALYLKRIDMGETPEQAAKAAHEEFGNFRTRSPALRVLRGGIAPFILYPAKVLPRFAKNVVDHPGRYMTLVAGWAALDQMGAAASGGEVDEEDIEYRDRRLLGYFFPGFTQTGTENDEGDKGGVDIARYTPVTGLTDVAQPGSPGAALSDRFPKILQPAGPFTDLYAKFANNYDTYLQQPRYKAYYGAKTNIARGLEDAAQFALPSIAGFHAEALYKDYQNKDFDRMKNTALGPTGLRPKYAARGRAMDNADYQLDKDLADIKRDMNRALDRTNDPGRIEDIMREADEREDRANELHDKRAYTRK